MPTETITLAADTIDGAAEQIIHLLEGTDNRRDIVYFHGWVGFGASAVLKTVVKKLRSSSGLADTRTARDLGKIIHIDFLQWQSMRALQKAIAMELELPLQVMALFDQHDEEDDFDGVEQRARDVIPYVKAAIMNELMACRFLVVFHNGSGSYIDLWDAGVPVIGQLSRRVLWTSRGRFWHHIKDGHALDLELDNLESAKWSNAAIFVLPSPELVLDEVAMLPVMRHALYAEAEEVAKYLCVPELGMSPETVIECILYRALRDNDHNINWESHASNYWVCDGIIQDDGTDGGRVAWEISDALQCNMSLDFCKECTNAIRNILSGEQRRFINRWVSVTSQNSTEVQLTSQTTSFFWTGGGRLEACLLQYSNKSSLRLRVIHLSHCAFSFSSPPFQSCSNLRFLLLDHCEDKDNAQDDGEENDNYHHHSHHSQENGGAWYQSLWVLELSHTDWYWLLSEGMLDLMSDLRELNVKGVSNRSMSHLHRCCGAGSSNSSRCKLLKLRVVAEVESSTDKLQVIAEGEPSKDKLRVVAESYKDDGHDGAGGDTIQQVSPEVVASSFPDLSSWRTLKIIVLDGCGDTEIIDSNALPLSLEMFSLTGNDTTRIKNISFQGHTQLKSLLLRGLLDSLEELDLSGTIIKTLDLTATQAKGLKRLFLLGCEKLHAILWPQVEGNKDNEVFLEVLRIDTTHRECDREEGKSNRQQEATTSDDYNARIGSSLATMCGKDRTIIDSASYISIRDPRFFRSLMNLRYSKVLYVEISSTGGHKGTPGQGIYSSSLNSDWVHCYISIQDETGIESLQGTTPTSTGQLTSATTLPDFVHMNATALYLHDSFSITCLPGPASLGTDAVYWYSLRWCRLEKCPNLGVVFTTPQIMKSGVYIFTNLQSFWASQLRKARYIWDWSPSGFLPGKRSFEDLVFLHLEYCPRLLHVLPLYASNTYGCHSLETLEIVCCGNLKEVFPSNSKSQQQEEPRKFPRLKRILLYELHKLQRICGRRMLAPDLETVRVRGCWGLKRLPAVGCRRSAPPVVDSEKDWWDGLEWDGESAGHHPSHYEPSYSPAYYKKKQLRASVLR